jgi:hypothetical protein
MHACMRGGKNTGSRLVLREQHVLLKKYGFVVATVVTQLMQTSARTLSLLLYLTVYVHVLFKRPSMLSLSNLDFLSEP